MLKFDYCFENAQRNASYKVSVDSSKNQDGKLSPHAPCRKVLLAENELPLLTRLTRKDQDFRNTRGSIDSSQISPTSERGSKFGSFSSGSIIDLDEIVKESKKFERDLKESCSDCSTPRPQPRMSFQDEVNGEFPRHFDDDFSLGFAPILNEITTQDFGRSNSCRQGTSSHGNLAAGSKRSSVSLGKTETFKSPLKLIFKRASQKSKYQEQSEDEQDSEEMLVENNLSNESILVSRLPSPQIKPSVGKGVDGCSNIKK
ncbi:uncharacterized protein PRCAT00002667001 [Priceomyces carsonii]|uniref:uncharacterized protein n=1 Tax=Priceomyces carsonii TaxID=28549 RepID=UPI002ED876CD|nr:unnamed protein product [Priceomyces carsonii]